MQTALDALGYDMTEQLWLLLYSLIIGTALGAVFDIFRISRVFLSMPPYSKAARIVSGAVIWTVSFLEDIVFFAVSAVTVILFCFQANDGSSRGFILIGALGGFVLYLQTVGRLTKLISTALSRLLWSIIGAVWKYIVLPAAEFVVGLGKKIYRVTVGRGVSFLLLRLRRRRTEFARWRLVRLCLHMFSETKGTRVKSEPRAYVHTGKTRNTAGIRVYDNYARQHSDRVQ